MWGGNHTIETDPTKQGWRVVKLQRAILVGKRNTKGCFSAICLGETIDIALYEEDPQEVATYLKGIGFCDPIFHQIGNYSGWGLTVLQLLRDMMEELEKYQ